MFQKTFIRKVLYPFAAASLIIGGTIAASPAHAVLSDNVYNTGSGGLTNCTGNGVCIKKVGDEIEVSYEVQMSNMMSSSDHGQTVSGSMIAFPSVIQNPKLEVVSTSIESSDYEKYEKILEKNGIDIDSIGSGENKGHPVHKFNKPVEVPILTPDEVKDGNPYDGGEISFQLTDVDNMDKDSSYVKTSSKDDKEGESNDLFYATHIKGEKILEDYKKTGKKDNIIKGIGNVEGISKESKIYNASLEKAGAMPVNSTYDYFTFSNDSRRGVNTYRISGKVKSESDLGFLPIRAKQGFWRCDQEGNGFGSSYGNGSNASCHNLMDQEWARSDDNLPEYSLKNDEVTKNNIKNNTEHGLAGSKKCAVTENTGKYDMIGKDVKPSDGDSTISWGDEYTNTFGLRENRAITYLVGARSVTEDGCDQAGVKIELCNKEDNKKDPSDTKPDNPVNKNDEDGTTAGDTPGKDNTINDKPGNTDNDKSDNVDKDKPGNVGKDNINNNKTDNVGNDSQQDKIENNSSGDPSDKQSKDKENIAQPNKFEPDQVNKELPANDKSASQYVQKNAPRVIAQDPANSINYVIPNSQGKKVMVIPADGMKVNTGGEVEKNTFFSKVFSIFV